MLAQTLIYVKEQCSGRFFFQTKKTLKFCIKGRHLDFSLVTELKKSVCVCV